MAVLTPANSHSDRGGAGPSRSLLRRGVMAGLLLILLHFGLFFPGVYAYSQSYSEYEVKAAFLFKFTKFVEWPAHEQADDGAQEQPPFRIGILGEDPFGELLDKTVQDQQAGGRKIEVVRGETLKALGHCEILYVSDSLEAEVEEVLAAVKEEKTLTVSDMKDFLDKGGMIHLDLDGSRVMFRINHDAAQASELRISAQLLQVAKEVRRSGGRNPGGGADSKGTGG